MAINDFFVWGKGGAKLTPDQIERERQISDALIKQGVDFSPVGHWTQGAARMANAFVGNLRQGRADRAQSEGIAGATDAFNNAGIAELLAGSGNVPSYSQDVSAAPALPRQSASDRSIPLSALDAPISDAKKGSFLSAIDRTEGGGSYDTLYGHAQKGGQFNGVRVSQMPISQVLAFSSPSGAYGQSVKNKVGHVATPMGRYQIVGSTLRNAAKEMGLDPNTPFSPEVQDAMATHIAKRAIAGKSNSAAINALRGTWEGFKSVPESQMLSIVGELRGSKTPVVSNSNTQVASADPNFMPQASSEVTMSPVAQALVQQGSPEMSAASGSQNGAGYAGEIRKGADGKNYQYAETTGMMGRSGGNGWIETTMQPQSGANLQGLIQLANNPFLNDAQRGMVNTALQYQMQQNDPMRALQVQQIQQGLRKGDLEIAAMQNPAKKPIEVGGVLLDPDTYQPIYDSRQKADGGFTLSEGQQRFDASGNPIASVAPKVDPDQYETQRIKMPDGSEVMVERRKGTNEPWQASQIPQGGTTGTGASIRLTEGQSKDTVYSTRAAGALPVIDSLGEYLTNPFERAKEYDPTGLIRGTQSPEYQQAKNAGDEFLQAILRKDTGAAIAKEEMSSYGSVYLPMPGDSKEVLEQKREARSRALNAMQAGMPPEAILAQERALKKTNDQTGKSKPISEMTDAELEAIANGN